MSDNMIKRLRYFNQQFLVEADFTDEQDYHRNMRLRHNSLFHTPGIAMGLEVVKTDVNTVKVTAGTAIDILGREIVQVSDSDSIELSDATGFPKNSTVYITIKYSEKTSDFQTGEDSATATRVLEKPEIKPYQVKDLPPDNTIIWLAKFDLTDGRVPGNQGDKFDNGLLLMPSNTKGIRKTVGVVLPDRSVSANKLKTELVQEGDVDLDGGPGGTSTKDVNAFRTTLDKPNSAFILVYAFAKNIIPANQVAKFSWAQVYSTSATEINQVVTFKAESNNKFTVHYRIYSVLES